MSDKKAIKLQDMSSKPKYAKILKGISKTLSMIFVTIIILLIVAMGSITIQTLTNENKTASFFGFKIFRVASGSMEDTLLVGQVILVKETGIENLKVGDIISFRSSSTSTTTHRIIEISTNKETGETELTTKGDNNNSADTNKVTADMLEGKYLITIKGIGAIMTFINTTPGFACVIFFPILALTLIIAKEKTKAEKKSMRREKLNNFNSEISKQQLLQEQEKLKNDLEKEKEELEKERSRIKEKTKVEAFTENETTPETKTIDQNEKKENTYSSIPNEGTEKINGTEDNKSNKSQKKEADKNETEEYSLEKGIEKMKTYALGYKIKHAFFENKGED